MRRTREILICCVLVAAVAFLGCGAWFFVASQSALTGAHLNERLDRADKALGETHDKLQALIQDGKDSLDDNYDDMRAQVETTSVILRSLSETVDAVNGKLLPAATAAVNNLGSAASNGADAARSLRGAVDQLGVVSAALKVDAEAAKPTIDGATTLLSTLNTGSGQALDRMSATISDTDELVKAARPIEAHVEAGTKSVAETLGFIRDDFSPKKKSFWVRLADTATSGMFSVFLHWLPQRVREVH